MLSFLTFFFFFSCLGAVQAPARGMVGNREPAFALHLRPEYFADVARFAWGPGLSHELCAVAVVEVGERCGGVLPAATLR